MDQKCIACGKTLQETGRMWVPGGIEVWGEPGFYWVIYTCPDYGKRRWFWKPAHSFAVVYEEPSWKAKGEQ